jgi:hypothetical protein
MPGRLQPPGVYARGTIAVVPGFRGLRAGRPRPVRAAPYPAARVPATGTFRATGLRQAIDLYALHRRGVATYTLIAFRSAAVPARRYAPLVARLVRTFHSQPPAR